MGKFTKLTKKQKQLVLDMLDVVDSIPDESFNYAKGRATRKGRGNGATVNKSIRKHLKELRKLRVN